MNQHPAKTMLLVWSVCIVFYFVMPFQLMGRQLAIQGVAMLVVFIAAFLVGTFMVPTHRVGVLISPTTRIDACKVEAWLMRASGLAILFFILDAKDRDLSDLNLAYELRSEAASALLQGMASNSSIWFRMAFLLYPAAYVLAVIHLIYAYRVNIWRVVLFGFLPPAMASMVMGGHTPIFYLVIVTWIAIKERKKLCHLKQPRAKIGRTSELLIKLIGLLAFVSLFQYFVAVFMARANIHGGSKAMLDRAEESWGIGFHGLLSDSILTMFGSDFTYLIFIFAWYVVQGFVMSNYLFVYYHGPWQIGAYGIDLISAIVRRLDPQMLAEGFDRLLMTGVYGFFPSAWGSLYVDFGLFALILCIAWGAISGLCYKRIVLQSRIDWLLVGPFVTIGIICSSINTPLGFSNGFITHIWVVLTFFMLKRLPG